MRLQMSVECMHDAIAVAGLTAAITRDKHECDAALGAHQRAAVNVIEAMRAQQGR